MAGAVDADDDTVAGLDRGEHGVVLGGAAHGHAGAAVERAEHRGVVGLRAAAGEDDLARPAADRRGDDVAGLVDARRASRAKRCEPDGLA